MSTFVKDPEAVLDYGFDWSDWLADGEVISASTWTIPTGLTKVSDSFDDNETVAWLSGGTVEEVYTIVNHIVTSDGREDDRSHVIKMRNR